MEQILSILICLERIRQTLLTRLLGDSFRWLPGNFAQHHLDIKLSAVSPNGFVESGQRLRAVRGHNVLHSRLALVLAEPCTLHPLPAGKLEKRILGRTIQVPNARTRMTVSGAASAQSARPKLEQDRTSSVGVDIAHLSPAHKKLRCRIPRAVDTVGDDHLGIGVVVVDRVVLVGWDAKAGCKVFAGEDHPPRACSSGGHSRWRVPGWIGRYALTSLHCSFLCFAGCVCNRTRPRQ